MVSNKLPHQIKLQPIKFSDIPKWPEDDHLAAFKAFLPCTKLMQAVPYKTKSLGVDGTVLRRVGGAALALKKPTGKTAQKFFETEFTPCRLTQADTSGFVTGFFEPLVKASRKRSERFSIPLHRRPDELIDVNDSNRPADMDPYFKFGESTADGIKEYHDRHAIQSGALDDMGLEIVWLENKVDAFFIQIQGAAKLLLEEGGMMRVTFAAKSGHRYTSIAKILSALLGIAPEKMTADRLADWMHANPEQIDALLAHNQSYIFFKTIDGLDPDAGPIAAAKVPLIAGRSLAVDKSLHTFGCPIWLAIDEPLPNETAPMAKLMIAHDTGSAMIGAARGDIFVGTGKEAGLIAGKIRHSANFILLIPKP